MDVVATWLSLPDDLLARNPTRDDLDAIVATIEAFDRATTGEVDDSRTEILEEWAQPGFSFGADAWVVTTPDGFVAGYASVWSSDGVRIRLDGYVHPAHQGRGIGTYLLRRMEARGREYLPLAPEGLRVFLDNGIVGSDMAAHRLHQAEGFTQVRHFWRMRIAMTEAPVAPSWPAGIVVRTMIVGQDDRAVFDAREEAFQDHWGHVPQRFETWNQLHDESFDPSLWFLAMDGDAIAGVASCKMTPDHGWIGHLGVRRPWRRRGLATALLQHIFGEFYRRGQPAVALGVDAQSHTGAPHLYQQAGMTVVREFAVYQKELRPGRDMTTQDLP